MEETVAEIAGDVFSYKGHAYAVCVTTNGVVKSNGELVMVVEIVNLLRSVSTAPLELKQKILGM